MATGYCQTFFQPQRIFGASTILLLPLLKLYLWYLKNFEVYGQEPTRKRLKKQRLQLKVLSADVNPPLLVRALWFVLEIIMAKNENNSHAFLRKMVENIKQTKDAQCPDDAKANEVQAIACSHTHIHS